MSTPIRHVLTLMTGTALAQLIPIGIAPLLTRIYSSTAMGEWATFVAATSLTAVVLDFRYSLSIMVAPTSSLAFCCLCLAVSTAVGTCAILGVSVGLCNASGLCPTWFPSIFDCGAMLTAALLTSVSQSCYAWSNRQARYKLLAAAKMSQAVVTGGLAISISNSPFNTWTNNPLIASYLVGIAAGALLLAWPLCRLDRPYAANVRLSSLLSCGKQYVRFPLLSIPADLINTLANSLPLFFFGYYFSPALVGLFSLTNRVMLTPTSLIARAIQDVFKEQASRQYVETGSCRNVFVSTLTLLLSISVPLFSLVALCAPTLFSRTFGQAWEEAGYFCRYLTPLFILRFAATPMSYMFYLAEKQAYDLAWQVVLCLSLALSLWFGGVAGRPHLAIALFSAVYSAAYLVYIAMSARLTTRDVAPVPEG